MDVVTRPDAELAAELSRELRARSGLSQRGLASRSGTSGPTIAAYEAGRKEPRLSTLQRMARASGHALDIVIRSTDRGDLLRERRARRSRVLAAATAAKVKLDPIAARAVAMQNLRVMRGVVGTNRSHELLDAWEQLLGEGPEAVGRQLLAPGEHEDDMRAMAPFAGLLTPDERSLVLAIVDSSASHGP